MAKKEKSQTASQKEPEGLIDASKKYHLSGKILSQNETPGLGARVAEPAFTAAFGNKKASDLAGVQAITGATISSHAVIDSVKKRAEEIKGMIKNEK